MTITRNWFIRLALFIAVAIVCMMLYSALTVLQELTQSDYLTVYLVLIAFFAGFLLIYLVTGTGRLIRNRASGKAWKRVGVLVELLFIGCVLAAGFYLRYQAVLRYSVGMESDYKLYYDIAKMLHDGTILTASNNEYISLFPHTFGYSFLLSVVMRIFGTQPEVCFYFNICVSLLTALVLYGIGKTLYGSGAGLAAMIISTFWPSQILFSTINGAEAVFTGILYGAALLAIRLLRKYNGDTQCSSVRAVLMHLAVGALIAVASFVRPMAVIMVIAVAICLLTLTRRIHTRLIRERNFGYIFLSNGVFRAAAVLVGYAVCATLLTAGLQATIGAEVAGAGATGYSIMVGTDLESEGGYSERSKNFLYETYRSTGDLNETHALCAKVAMESIKEHPWETIRLLGVKAYLLWSSDDYASKTTYYAMEKQGFLSSDNAAFLADFTLLCNIYYLFILFLSGIGVLLMFRRDNNAALFVVFFIGAVALHLVVEVQNRYHYYLLQCLAILASSVVGYLMHVKSSKRGDVINDETGAIPNLLVHDLPAAPAQTNLGKIDVLQAILDGHITVTATETYSPPNLSINKASLRKEEPVRDEGSQRNTEVKP